MRINRIIPETYAEGPGCRFCIWVQGCPHKCEGCFAKDTWDFSGGVEYNLDEIKEMFDSVAKAVEGLTVLGGEPFEQAEELTELCRWVRNKGKNVIVFSGYTYNRIASSQEKEKTGFLQVIDILIDGKFDKNLVDFSRPLVGSSNQEIIFLSDRINKKDFYEYKNRFEIRFDDKGRISINGMGNLKNIEKLLKTRGDRNE